MACQVFGKGKDTRVIALNQEESKLYSDLKKLTGNQELSLELWKTAYTEQFQDKYGAWVLATQERMKDQIPLEYRRINEYQKHVLTHRYKNWDQLYNTVDNNLTLDKNGEPNVEAVLDFGNQIGIATRTTTTREREAIDKAAAFIYKKKSDLLKQVSRFKGTENDYTSRITELINKFDELDTAEAVYEYESYMHDLLGKRSEKTGKMLGIEGRLNNLESLDYNSMSDSEFNKVFLESANALHQIAIILNSVKDIRTLDTKDYKGTPIQAAVKNLKEESKRIADLDSRFRRISKDLYRKRLGTMSSNPAVLAEGMDIFDAQLDENGGQRWLDAMADTNNTFLALVVKDITQQNERRTQEVNRKTVQFEKEVKRLNQKGININEFFEEYKGKRTGKFIREYDWNKYGEIKAEVNQQARELQERIDRAEDDATVRSLTKQKKKLYAKFFSEHEKQRENYTELVAEARKKFGAGSTKFHNWYWSNHYYSETTGKVYAKGELIRPSDMYKNKKYEQIMANPDKARFMNYMSDLISELVDHSQETIMHKGYLPAVPLDQRQYWEVMRDIVYKKKEPPATIDGMLEAVVDENGRIVHFLPFHYMRLLDQVEMVQITEDMTDGEKKAARAENRKRYKENRTRHAEAIDYDLEATMPLFIKTALNHKYKKEMEGSALLAAEIFKGEKVLKSRGSKVFMDKILQKKTGDVQAVTKSAENSNVVNHYEDYLRMVFYEEFQNEEKLQTLSNSLQNYTSFKGIGFNPLSALNNLALGTIMQNIEASGGVHYSVKDWGFAQKAYNSNIARFVVGRDKRQSTHVTEGIIKFFDILQSQDELYQKVGGPQKSILHRLKFISDAAYAMQHLGEHMMQNKALLAMTNKFRVDSSGKIYRDAKTYAKKNGLYKQYMENVDTQANIIEKFNSLGTLYDNFELDSDGLLTEKIKLKPEEISFFKQEVIGVNQANHGIYNKEDAGAMQQYALGRLGIQFRKWARPGWNKRFGPKFWETSWNERRNIHDEGMYVSTMKFLGDYISGLRQLNFNYKLHLNNMDEQQQANVRKTFTEFLYLIGIKLFVMLLSGMADEDRELEKSKAFNLAIYQTDRLTTELQVFQPYGFINESRKLLRSPAAVTSVFEDILALGSSLYYDAIGSDKAFFQGGARYGDRKSAKYFRDMVPFYNQLGRIGRLEDDNKYYKLY